MPTSKKKSDKGASKLPNKRVKASVNNSLKEENKIDLMQRKAGDAFREFLEAERKFYLNLSKSDKEILERAKAFWQVSHSEFLGSIIVEKRKYLKTIPGFFNSLGPTLK